MNTTNFENTIRKVEKLLTDLLVNSFFEENYISLNITSATYLILKNSYHKNDVISSEFKATYSQFYGLKRFVDEDFTNKYFEKMNNLRGLKEYDIFKLCYELVDNKGRVQFSFATKMLNIMNDEKYPIYDRYVAKVFNIYPKVIKIKDEKIMEYVNNYQFINNIYLSLLPLKTELIKKFREIFGYSETELSNLRIMDIIIWKIGDKMLKNK